MKKQPRRARQTSAPQPQPPKRMSGMRLAAVVGAVLLAAGAGWAWGKYRNATPPTTQPATAAQPAPANRPKPAAAAQIDIQKLVGRWQRLDGGYVLEIRSVGADGTLDAAYLNPRPIHVAKAQAAREGEMLTVFIELRDKNYPGSTYQLAYDPQGDQLSGIYFQAVEQQQFEVAFDRMK